MDEITEKDWDEFMEKHPDLKKKHEEWLLFIKLNPKLANDVDLAIKKILDAKENK